MHFRSGLKSNIGARNTSAVGAACEMIVCAELLMAGFEVYRAISSSAPFDLVAEFDGELIRIEVKAVGVRKNGDLSIAHARFNEDRFDVLAAVLPNNSLHWFDGSGELIEEGTSGVMDALRGRTG